MFLALKCTLRTRKRRKQFHSFMFHEIQNTDSFDSFECIENIALKLNFYNCKILVLARILIKFLITITECRALQKSFSSCSRKNLGENVGEIDPSFDSVTETKGYRVNLIFFLNV